jgi:hypothetical protein
VKNIERASSAPNARNRAFSCKCRTTTARAAAFPVAAGNCCRSIEQLESLVVAGGLLQVLGQAIEKNTLDVFGRRRPFFIASISSFSTMSSVSRSHRGAETPRQIGQILDFLEG